MLNQSAKSVYVLALPRTIKIVQNNIVPHYRSYKETFINLKLLKAYKYIKYKKIY